MKNFKIGDKLTRFPLIQGGMGVGISLGRLAGTVAKEGGIGIISTAQIGYREKDFDRNTEEANQRAILSEMKKARRISPDGIIGYNIMVALKEYASHVKAAVHAGADLIISGAGLPTELPALVSGSKTKIAPIVSTAAAEQRQNALPHRHPGGPHQQLQQGQQQHRRSQRRDHRYFSFPARSLTSRSNLNCLVNKYNMRIGGSFNASRS